MRVFYRNNDVLQTSTEAQPSQASLSKVVKGLIAAMTDKKLSDADRDKAFRFFYAVPPSQRDEAWVTAASAFLNKLP